MILKSTIWAELDVDVLMLDRPGALEGIASQLERTIIAEGENVGAFIRPGAGSIWIRTGVIDETTWRRPVRGEWSPDPMLGCEFQGGPYDGDVKPMRRETDGRPAGHVQLVAPAETAQFGPSDFEEVLGFPVDLPVHPRYRLEGKNGETDRWVYVLDA